MVHSTENKSWLSTCNPTLKLLLSLVMVILILFLHNINIVIFLTGFLAFSVLFGTGQKLGRISLYILPFLFIFVSTCSSMILFGKGTTLWWQWGPIVITQESFYRGLHIGLRALCFGFTGLLFALTTRPVLLFYSLMQQLKLPPRYAYGFMASLRMLPLMMQEFYTLKKAYKVRGVSSPNGLKNITQSLRLYSIPLLAQSIRRAQRIAIAMEAKQFLKSKRRTYYYQPGFSKFDGLMILCLAGIFAAAFLMGSWWPITEIKDVRFNG